MAHVNALLDTKEAARMGRGKRPISITVISVVLIAIGSIVLLLAVSVSGDTTAYWFTVWVAVLGAAHLIPGIAILKGHNWGRLLYLCSIPIIIAFDWVVIRVFGGFELFRISKCLIALYVPFLVFLVRPIASAFFTHRDSER